MEIRVEPLVEGEDVTAALGHELRNALGIRVAVEQVPHGTLPRFDLKARRFTDHRGRA
jgi:phenylacetate-CoA ligase